MKRGKPAAGGSAKKAEKPITSFFFKKPESSPTKGTAEGSKRAVDANEATTSSTPPAKRQRACDAGTTEAVTTEKPHTPSVGEQDVAMDEGGQTATRVTPAAALKATPPSNTELHDRFVKKLALDFQRRDGTDNGNGRGSREAGTSKQGGEGQGNQPMDTTNGATEREYRPSNRPGASGKQKPATKLTPLEEQVKKHKAEHPGVLLLIEVGYKFHFYGEDARVASKVLNIFAYQSRNYLTASVPVPRLHVYVRRLVDAGHKVGVIRQTETAALKANGETDGGKSSLFERKLVGLYTRSTLEAGVAIDASGSTNDKGENIAEADGRLTSYLLCICERTCELNDPLGSDHGASQLMTQHDTQFNTKTQPAQGTQSTQKECTIGLAAVDTSTGDVLHASFSDTNARHQLESRLLNISPAEVLLVEPVSAATKRLIYGMFGDSSGSSGVRVEVIDERSGYVNGGAEEAVAKTFQESQSTDETLSETPNTSSIIGSLPLQTQRATAVAFDWLQQFGLHGVSKLLGTFSFRPLNKTSGEMKLSPNVIRQLELLRSSENTHKGSLLWLLGANAVTPGGGRVVRRWVTNPLTDFTEITQRLSALKELKDSADPGCGGALEDLSEALRVTYGKQGCGDAERYLARVFHGTATPAELVNALGAIKAFAGAVQGMAERRSGGGKNAHDADVDSLAKSGMLRKLLQEACDPSVVDLCQSLLSAVDLENAKTGKATPATALRPDPTQFPELEITRRAIADAQRAMDDLLPVLRGQLVSGGEPFSSAKGKGNAVLGSGTKKHLIPSSLQYIKVALVEFLIELPDTFTNVPSDWIQQSTNKTKKVIRYHPPVVLDSVRQLERARERHTAACELAWRQFLKVRCAGKFLELRAAVRAAAGLDALSSFASLARQDGYCCPTFMDDYASSEDEPPSKASLLCITKGRHPILDATLAGGKSVVPNSVELGGRETEKNAIVITGPNMGGKSCFVRQTALLVIMAQVGSFVPADGMRLTPLNGVHTRMGAADNLAMGSSTFLEEMSECSSILNAVKTEKRSLVVLDELGRGTSTHDGVAVAHAVLEHLLQDENKGCLTLFVTHYPSVARDVTNKFPSKCAAAFTAYQEKTNSVCMGNQTEIAQDGSDDKSKNPPEVHSIDFLYSLTPGVAHRSFGLNVARMAGLPPSVLVLAAAKARELEKAMATRAATKLVRDKGGSGEQITETASMTKRTTLALCDVSDHEALARVQQDVRASRLREGE